MKKNVLVIAFLSSFLLAHTQQDSLLRSKKGRLILPEKHDYAIGISANSIFNYLGNFFSMAGTNSLNISLISSNSIYGKYFLNKQSAIRVRAFLNMNNANYSSAVPSDLDPTGKITVTDELKQMFTNFTFAAGFEKRKGYGRLQVFGGAELLLSQSNSTNDYKYGNQFSINNNNPTTASFFNTNPGYSRVNARTLNSSNNSGFGYGLRGFVGLEYFIFPKIAIGGEFGISGSNYTGGSNSSSTESWNYFKQQVIKQDLKSTNKRANAGTDNLSGQIMLFFYFN